MLKFQPVLPYRCIFLVMHGSQPLLELKTFKVPLFEGSEHYLLRLDNTRPPIQLKKTTVIGLELISGRYNQKQKLGDCPSYLTKWEKLAKD